MAWSTFIPDERIVGVGLMAAATIGLFVGVRVALQPYHDSSVVYPTPPKTQYITQDTEDSLSLDTLNSLLDHYNFSIRETAAKIVCDRAINDDATLGRLLWGIGRPGYDERMTSLRALAMLTDQNTLHRLNTREAFGAFVRSLEQCTASAERKKGNEEAEAEAEEKPADSSGSMIDDICFDEYYLRDIAEKLCLMFLAQLTDKFDVDLLVRVGFVDKWLAKQQWGGDPPQSGPSNSTTGPGAADTTRIDNFARYLKFRDNRIADICRRLRDSPVGRAALEKAQLVAPRRPQQHQQQQQMLHQKRLELLQLQNQRIIQQLDAATSSAAPSPLRVELRVVNGEDGPRGDLAAAVDTGDAGDAGDAGDVDAASVVAVDDTGNTGNAEAAVRSARAVLGALDLLDGEDNMTAEAVAADDGSDLSIVGSTTSSNNTRQPRPPSHNSREEQRIRRQHREAMVLNDGTRPLRRDDIIERESY